ncbi:hypothetical protein ACGFWD_39990 [Streptomyces sp. NPDC048448]|uniref:hypothetical protein n=1 Tax=Streptomyces sp. NPDC048448 TaxID=3365554 RepID=UPI003716035B
MRERTRWGWISWTVPSDGHLPETPHQIGIIAPGTTRAQRAILHWLTGRPGRRITLGRALPKSVRFSTVCAVIGSLLVGSLSIHAGLAVDVALPAMALVPLLIERLEGLLDDQDATHVRRIQGEAACRYTQRLTTLQDQLVHLDVQSDSRYGLRRATEIGHDLLWDVAAVLQTQDTRSVSSALIAREILMLRLVDQAEKSTFGPW